MRPYGSRVRAEGIGAMLFPAVLYLDPSSDIRFAGRGMVFFSWYPRYAYRLLTVFASDEPLFHIGNTFDFA